VRDRGIRLFIYSLEGLRYRDMREIINREERVRDKNNEIERE
jgi:hypothetical protein